jgi:DNA-binding XRE family transcriptional regulator
VRDAAASPIEVVPVVVLSQVFTARPSSIPDIRDFVRRCLAESPLNDEGNREVGETVFRALLDAAGPTGSIQVAFRIFPEHVEVDVLRSDTAITPPTVPGPPISIVPPSAQPGETGPARAMQAVTGPDGATGATRADSGAATAAIGGSMPTGSAGAGAGPGGAGPGGGGPGGGGPGGADLAAGGADQGGEAAAGHPETFAAWMSSALRREGLTQEAAARQLGVSVKTVSRWVGGATEPRMRDLRRIQEVFGEVPLP